MNAIDKLKALIPELDKSEEAYLVLWDGKNDTIDAYWNIDYLTATTIVADLIMQFEIDPFDIMANIQENIMQEDVSIKPKKVKKNGMN